MTKPRAYFHSHSEGKYQILIERDGSEVWQDVEPEAYWALFKGGEHAQP